MKKSLIALAVLAASGARHMTYDAAIKYRMDAGFPGDVNRTHPASIFPAQQDSTTPVRRYGDGAMLGANNCLRGFNAGDTAITKLQGILVRPYPTQQTSGGMTSTIGTATPPGANTVQDFIEDGYVMVKIDNLAAGNPVKGGAVFVWCAVTAGNDIQGGFRAVTSAGNTASIANAFFTGPADANGNAEIRIVKQ